MLLSKAEEILRQELSSITLKSINEVTREYQNILERYVVDTSNGNMTSGEMSRAHKSLLKRLAPEAYREGMREGGVRDPEAEMEDDDDETIDNWITEQSGYTSEFAKAVAEVSQLKGDEKKDKRNSMLARVTDWVNSLQYLGQRGYLSAKGNMPLTMKGDDGVLSCNECEKYNGQRHRKSWWDKRGLLDRPNEIFGCGRFDTCQHHYYDDDDNIIVN